MGVSSAVILTSIASYSAPTYLGSIDLFKLRRLTPVTQPVIATTDIVSADILGTVERPVTRSVKFSGAAPVTTGETIPFPPFSRRLSLASDPAMENDIATQQLATLPAETTKSNRPPLQFLEYLPEKKIPAEPFAAAHNAFAPNTELSNDGALDILNPSTSTVDAYLMAPQPLTENLKKHAHVTSVTIGEVQLAGQSPSLLGTLGSISDDIFQQRVPVQAPPPEMVAPVPTATPAPQRPVIEFAPLPSMTSGKSGSRSAPSRIAPVMPAMNPATNRVAAPQPAAPVPLTPAITSSIQKISPPITVPVTPTVTPAVAPIIVPTIEAPTTTPADDIPVISVPAPVVAPRVAPARPTNDIPEALQELLNDAPTEEDPTLWQYRRPSKKKSRDLIL